MQNETSTMLVQKRRAYTLEYKRQIVYHLQFRSINDVAEAVNISAKTLSKWPAYVRKADAVAGLTAKIKRLPGGGRHEIIPNPQVHVVY
jgi:hypothetical protein